MKNMKRITGLTALALVVTLALLLSAASPVLGAGTPPTSISPPENFAGTNDGGGAVTCTMSAPDDLRVLIGQTDKERGYGMKILAQVDFKTDGGSWHYSPDWDSATTFTKHTLNFYNVLTGGEHGRYLGHIGFLFKTMFPGETNVPVPHAFNSWDWFKSHSITLRARFAIDFGNKNIVFSGWSKEYVLSDSSKMDYKKIMNENGPTILSSKIETRGVKQVPWVVLQLAQHPDAVQLFNAASGDAMRTEVWMKKSGDTEFKNVGNTFFGEEIIMLDVSAYFDDKQTSYDAAAYEVKVRYRIDERKYQQSGAKSMNLIYSKFSNTLSYGMPAYTGSAWAAGDLQKAADQGLIPDILKGQDLTKNITREEFAEVALLMYQKASGISNQTPATPNPFVDTANPQVLKAFKQGIVVGYSATEFKPKELINREQVAAILLRVIKMLAPNADYSIAGAPSFTDQKDISDWALSSCLYMAKIGIIRGSDGKFMPRAITSAQQAAGYANTTREQALIMSLRTVEKMK